MKKVLFSLLTACLFGFGMINTASADDINIGNITVRFCSGDEHLKELNIITDAEEENEICMNFINSMNSDVIVKYSFVDGTITDDEYSNRACTTNEMQNFGQFVTQTEYEIKIPAKDIVHQTATVKFPTGMNGIVNGCLVYSLVKEGEQKTDSSNSMFNIEVRKASFITAAVGGAAFRDLAQKESIYWTYDRSERTLNVMVPMHNQGNIDELATFTGHLTNIFGFDQEFEVTRRILANSDHVLMAQIPNMPWYRLFFTLHGTITSEPALSFDPSLLDELYRGEKSINAHLPMSIFLFPRELLFILIGLIILGFVIRYLSKHLRFEK